MEARTPGPTVCQGGLWMFCAHQIVDASSLQLGETADAGHW